MTDTHPLSTIPDRRIPRHMATDQDLSALAAIRTTEPGVMQVGLVRVRRGSPHRSQSFRRTFRILRDAARLALCQASQGRPRYAGRPILVIRHVRQVPASAVKQGKEGYDA